MEGEAGKEVSSSYRLSWPEHKHLAQSDAGVASVAGSRHSQVQVLQTHKTLRPRGTAVALPGSIQKWNNKTFPCQTQVEKLCIKMHQGVSQNIFANVLNLISSSVEYS